MEKKVLDRNTVLKELKAFSEVYSPDTWYVSFKAALVLYGIFPNTNDIDIMVTEEVANSLLQKGCQHSIVQWSGNVRITINEHLEAFYQQYDTSKKPHIEGIRVDDINTINSWYKRMNREKDQKVLQRLSEITSKVIP